MSGIVLDNGVMGCFENCWRDTHVRDCIASNVGAEKLIAPAACTSLVASLTSDFKSLMEGLREGFMFVWDDML